MNLSTVSVYDNVDSQDKLSKSSVYQTINNLLDINGDVEVKIYCPLCVNSFDYKFSLFEHLRTFHNNFLIQAGNQTLKFKECPFCSSKFYGKHLTVKHALHHHSKVVRELFVNKNRSAKCSFCNMKLNRRDCASVVKHIEDLHLLEFEEEFRKTFSCDVTLEMTISELVNSTIQNGNSLPDSSDWEDVCMNVGNKSSGNEIQVSSEEKDFDEASKINCYDFKDLKEQLESIKGCESVKKSILKDVKNSFHSPTPQKSARRVLRFDLPPCSDKNKENSVLKQNLETFKQINIDEHSLLCSDNKNEIHKLFNNTHESSENLCGEPQHSSTPNFEMKNSKPKILAKDEIRRKQVEAIKSNFKSYLQPKNAVEFEFQCGKCRKLFKENLDLVFHVKNNHKKFSLNVLQPCYRCAICNARFFKNYYLRKHHSLHKPY